MIDVIRELLSRHVENDIREAFLTLPVPGLGTLGCAAPHPIWWLQVSVILTIQSTINAITAISIYYLVVKQRGSLQSYLIGYGIICPALVTFPFQLSQFLGVHSISMMVGQAGLSTVVLLRCLMAIHATLPSFVEKDLPSLVMFFVSPVQFEFDAKSGQVIKSTSESFRVTLWKTIQLTIVLTLVLNTMIFHDFELFQRREVNTFLDLFYWRNLCNNYAMACLTCSGLAGGTMLVGTLIEALSGNCVIELCDSPLTKSSSISDFWGRRWNALVHIVLKGGVYIPLRKNGFPAGMAAFVTFAASGILHEYILTAMSETAMLKNNKPFTPNYGNHLAFFAWNGVVLVLEGLFYKHPLVQQMKRRLPSAVITAMVIMTVLPIGHWFTDEYAEIGFYQDFAVGMPELIWTPFRQHVHW